MTLFAGLGGGIAMVKVDLRAKIAILGVRCKT